MRIVSKRDERGATAVMVGILVVSMIGFGALAIDVSSLVQERRTLQNSADAAALAVARDCAKNATACASSNATAGNFTDLNADDGDSDVQDICGNRAPLLACSSPPPVPSGATGYVRVTTSSRDAGSGAGEVPFSLARVITSATGATVRASSAAAWGPIGRATVVPLTFSKCEYDKYTAGGPLQTGPPFTGPPRVIEFHSSTDCAAPPSGFDFPGGFGWLKDPDSNCNLQVDAAAWADDKTGNSITGTGCDPANWRDKTILLPVFDYSNGLNGSKGRYHIAGFAALRVTGYRFVGTNGGTWPSAAAACSPPKTCIAGYITRFVTVGTAFGGSDFGSVIVKLVA